MDAMTFNQSTSLNPFLVLKVVFVRKCPTFSMSQHSDTHINVLHFNINPISLSRPALTPKHLTKPRLMLMELLASMFLSD